MTADKAPQQRPSPFGRKPNPTVARMLRKKATNAEQLLWSLLRNRQCGGFKFRRQYQVGIYVLDFYCHEAGVGVELDGGQHGEPGESKRDEVRTAFLERAGIRVVRFWNNEVLRETDGVLERLLVALDNHSCPHPDPLPEGEGRGKGR